MCLNLFLLCAMFETKNYLLPSFNPLPIHPAPTENIAGPNDMHSDSHLPLPPGGGEGPYWKCFAITIKCIAEL